METVGVFYLLSRFIVILHRCKWRVFLNWLPQIKQSVCCVIGEVIQLCSLLLQTTVLGATRRVSAHSYGKTLQQRGQFQSQDYWTVRKDRQTDSSLCCNCWLCCCFLTERHKKSTLWCSFIYICVQTASWPAVCVCFCGMEDRVTLSMWQPFSKLVTSGDSGAKHLQRGSFERNFSDCFINWCRYEILSMPHLFSLSFWMSKQSCVEFMCAVLNLCVLCWICVCCVELKESSKTPT